MNIFHANCDLESSDIFVNGNGNKNENYFKTKIVAYWPVVSAKVQYSHNAYYQ